jgi:hypothetical protein
VEHAPGEGEDLAGDERGARACEASVGSPVEHAGDLLGGGVAGHEDQHGRLRLPDPFSPPPGEGGARHDKDPFDARVGHPHVEARAQMRC